MDKAFGNSSIAHGAGFRLRAVARLLQPTWRSSHLGAICGDARQALRVTWQFLRLGLFFSYARRTLRREWRLLRNALFFSLMSTVNIGFRDINFGRWLRMLTKREYDIKPVGWARTMSGIQSLLSVYLIALWVLTYFGHPFE
jgi:hypothetical protein